ncbi:MAG: response regulator transcription factor [Rhodothermia bacterium]|nr:response regulator transcription factor [Rhodothermia bacterium]
MAIQILIADDHPLMRLGIRNRLAQEDDFLVVAEAKDGLETVRLTIAHEPDVLLLDLDLPEANGIEVLEKLSAQKIKTKILILSAYNSPHYVRRVLGFGVMGYLNKRESLDTIAVAVRGVAAGQSGWFSPDIAGQMSAQAKNNPIIALENPQQLLTGRECDVLIAAAKGMAMDAIADHLCISVHTVRKHLSNIYEKIGVSDRSEAIAWAWQVKLMQA